MIMILTPTSLSNGVLYPVITCKYITPGDRRKEKKLFPGFVKDCYSQGSSLSCYSVWELLEE